MDYVLKTNDLCKDYKNFKALRIQSMVLLEKMEQERLL